MGDEIHYPFIREVLKVAEDAAAHGNHPFGALLVKDGEVIMRLENKVNTERDITRHPEIDMAKAAAQQYDRAFLQDCIMYASTEPCGMCTGAIYWSGIGTIVFACSSGRLMEITGSGLNLTSREALAHATHPPTVIGPVLEDEAVQIHQRFWK